MVRLNKNILAPAQLREIVNQFNKSFNNLPNNKPSEVLSELLGDEELIMLTKRLAIIVLLLENKTLYEISNLLKVSASTAGKIKYKLSQGEYNETIGCFCRNKKSYFSLLETLDSVLHLGGILPHYNGLDRYKHLR